MSNICSPKCLVSTCGWRKYCLCVTVSPALLLDEIEASESEGNDDRVEGLLCGAVKQLKLNRAKPDTTLYLSLMFLAKIKPNVFATEGIIEVRIFYFIFFSDQLICFLCLISLCICLGSNDLKKKPKQKNLKIFTTIYHQVNGSLVNISAY